MSLRDTGRPTRGVGLFDHGIVKLCYSFGSNKIVDVFFFGFVFVGLVPLGPCSSSSSVFFYFLGFFLWPFAAGVTPGCGGHAWGGDQSARAAGCKAKYQFGSGQV